MSDPTMFHTLFYKWLKNSDRILVIPLVREVDKENDLTYTLKGITKHIKITVCEDEISIWIDHNNECWDIIEWLECFPEETPDGVICTECLDKRVYKDYAELVDHHIFQTLTAWINEDLYQSDYLGLGSTPSGGGTWAKLLKKDDLKGFNTLIKLRDAENS